MDRDRRNAIAYLYLLLLLRRKGITIDPLRYGDQVKTTARDLGIPEDEAFAFAQEVLQDIGPDSIVPEKGLPN